MKVRLRRCVGVVLLLLLFVTGGLSNRHGSTRRGNRRSATRRGGSGGNQDLMHLLSLIQSQLDDGDAINLTPVPPTQEEVQCHVTVQQTVHIGGRCVFLGSQYHPACQSGPHLDPFNDECRLRRLNNTMRTDRRGSG
ncbi:uncharacterized protein LOC121380171 [Gigantopelta aegis]|uniref:uncharacterized protein LOC121380171 n=1 Tax=Gigantopelta aegis TaxID=1735272 RepID=UPI001B88CE86|nr:uncharacterized protein LOC121380171 [Gigantopelta aegis]XP_041364906.1 uncharacterized protein LOC121380171 [Gigantopelta aegis]